MDNPICCLDRQNIILIDIMHYFFFPYFKFRLMSNRSFTLSRHRSTCLEVNQTYRIRSICLFSLEKERRKKKEKITFRTSTRYIRTCKIGRFSFNIFLFVDIQ